MASQTLPIQSPGGYVPTSAVTFSDAQGRGQIVAAATPLPVTLVGGGSQSPGLRALRLAEPPALHPSPPRIVYRTDAAPLIADPLVVDRLDPRLTPCYAPLIQTGTDYPRNLLSKGGWIADSILGNPPFAVAWGLRFLTDSPRVEFRIGYPGAVRLWVDGQPISVSTSAVLPLNEPRGWPQVGIDFGDDAVTLRPRPTVSAAGTGYAEGDVLTVAGSGGTPIALLVTGIGDGGAIVALAVSDWGALTGLQSGAVAAAGGSGTGATVTLTDDLGTNGSPYAGGTGASQRGHTTRRMRRIEIVFDGGSAQIGDVRVTASSTVRPWPFTGPRMMVMQDSYGQVFPDHAGGQWPFRAAQRLGVEDVWLNSFGGTGFTAGPRPYGERLWEIAAQLPQDRPLIFLTQGSINDAGASADDLRAAVQTYWTAAFAALPQDAVMVQTGILRAPGNNPADALSAAVRDGFAAACAAADPFGRRSGFIETRVPLEMMTVGGRTDAPTGTGATDFWISGDSVHPTQAGHDYIADSFAPELLTILRHG